MATTKPTRVVFQFPNVGSWLENIAIRPSGNILITRLDVPELWEVDPKTGSGFSIATFPAPLTSLSGVTEVTPDVFAVGTGVYKLGEGTVPGTYEVHLLDLNESSPKPKLVTKINECGLLNGMTTWDANNVLCADSEYGSLYKVDVATGTYTKVLDDDLLKSPEGSPMQIGINGIKIKDGYLYYTNSMRQTFFRAPIGDGAVVSGHIEPVVSGIVLDDFALAEDGTAYLTTHFGNSVVKIAPGSKEVAVVAGNIGTLEMPGTTACALGRGKDDKQTLYVVTAGGLSSPVNGQTEPAKVVAVDLA